MDGWMRLGVDGVDFAENEDVRPADIAREAKRSCGEAGHCVGQAWRTWKNGRIMTPN